MDLLTWMTIGDNAKHFREWREDSMTREILDVLRDECVPRKIPLHLLSKEGSAILCAEENGRHMGMNHIVDLLRHGDDPEKMRTNTTLVSDYGVEQYLVEEGYTQQDAKVIADEIARGEHNG